MRKEANCKASAHARLTSPHSLPIFMSSMATSSSSFQPILDAALLNYRNQTKIDLTKHPSAEKLQNSSSLDDILQLLLERESAFNGYRDKHRKLIDSLRPIVQAVHAFSTICGEAAGLVRVNTTFPLYLHVLMPPHRFHSSRQRRYSLELMFFSQYVSHFFPWGYCVLSIHPRQLSVSVKATTHLAISLSASPVSSHASVFIPRRSQRRLRCRISW